MKKLKGEMNEVHSAYDNIPKGDDDDSSGVNDSKLSQEHII